MGKKEKREGGQKGSKKDESKKRDAPKPSGYLVGSVSSALNAAPSSSAPSALVDLFSKPVTAANPAADKKSLEKARKKAKKMLKNAEKAEKKRQENEEKEGGKRSFKEAFDSSAEQIAGGKEKKKKKKKGKVEEPATGAGGETTDDRPRPQHAEARVTAAESFDKDKKTVFVGNVPTTTSMKALHDLFGAHGKVESVRFRSVAFENVKMPRKGAFITKNFRENRNSMNAYVVFKEEKSAAASVALNGVLVGDKHIRVDRVGQYATKQNPRLSAFVGNLPFELEDEDLRQHFAECGEIVSVRVIRDKTTNLGKGIAYVAFKNSDGVLAAVRMNGKEFLKRKLRVTRCFDTEAKKKKDQKKEDHQRQKQQTATKFRKKKTHPGAIGGIKKEKKKKQKDGKTRSKKKAAREEKKKGRGSTSSKDKSKAKRKA